MRIAPARIRSPARGPQGLYRPGVRAVDTHRSRTLEFDASIITNLADVPEAFLERVRDRLRANVARRRQYEGAVSQARPTGAARRLRAFFTLILIAKLPAERGPNGEPSTNDFQVFELLRIVDRFATRFDDLPELIAGRPEYRILIAAGSLVPGFAVIGQLAGDGAVVLDPARHRPQHPVAAHHQELRRCLDARRLPARATWPGGPGGPGGPPGARTLNQRIKSPMLYR